MRSSNTENIPRKLDCVFDNEFPFSSKNTERIDPTNNSIILK